jgi:hypothetical protein
VALPALRLERHFLFPYFARHQLIFVVHPSTKHAIIKHSPETATKNHKKSVAITLKPGRTDFQPDLRIQTHLISSRKCELSLNWGQVKSDTLLAHLLGEIAGLAVYELMGQIGTQLRLL